MSKLKIVRIRSYEIECDCELDYRFMVLVNIDHEAICPKCGASKTILELKREMSMRSEVRGGGNERLTFTITMLRNYASKQVLHTILRKLEMQIVRELKWCVESNCPFPAYGESKFCVTHDPELRFKREIKDWELRDDDR